MQAGGGSTHHHPYRVVEDILHLGNYESLLEEESENDLLVATGGTGNGGRKYATVEEVNEECELLKPGIWVSDLISLEEEEPLEPLELDIKVVKEVEEEEMEVAGSRKSSGLEVVEAPLAQIQEKNLIGSYSKGVIPIRSASFSSSNEKYKRPAKKGEEVPSEESSVKESVTVASPEITVHLIDDGSGNNESKSDKADRALDTKEEEERGGGSDQAQSSKLSELLHKFELEVGGSSSCKLTRALSESRKNQRRTRVGQGGGNGEKINNNNALPASLQHLYLEARCTSKVGGMGGGRRKVRTYE